MIIGIGTDIVAIERIRRSIDTYGERFISRCFTKDEIAAASGLKDDRVRLGYFAKRWAAKEAIAKAAGTGIGKYVAFQDIDISSSNDWGKPIVNITGKSRSYIAGLVKEGSFKLDISLSDEKDFAIAFVVISSTLSV